MNLDQTMEEPATTTSSDDDTSTCIGSDAVRNEVPEENQVERDYQENEQEKKQPQAKSSTPTSKTTISQDKASLYNTVVEDLRDKGLRDLADQILRLTAIDRDPGLDGDLEGKSFSTIPNNGNHQSTASATTGSTRSPEESQRRLDKPLEAYGTKSLNPKSTREQDQASKQPDLPPGQMFFLRTSAMSTSTDPIQASNSESVSYSMQNTASKGNIGTLHSNKKELQDADDHDPGAVAPTPSLERGGAVSSDGFPGAYSVTPSTGSSSQVLLPDEIDTETYVPESEGDGGGFEVDSEPAGLEPNETDGTGALEAFRVDDIMTVKAEPLANKSNYAFKVIGCVAFAVVAIVVVLATTLTVSRNEQENLEATPTPTYDAGTRFQLIQDILLEHFAPFYDQNYNTTNGTAMLLEALWDETTPQYQALDWMSRRDTELQRIAVPFLEDIGAEITTSETTDSRPDFSVIGEGESGTRGGSRQRNRRRLSHPISRDRIAQRFALAVLFYSYESWTDVFEFLSAEHECDWSGALQCDDDQKVVYLDLQNNGLQGSLPLELAALTNMLSLNLASNGMTGTLPPSLMALSKLTYLDLGWNSFTGQIPDVYYQNWKLLEFWILSENAITGTMSSYIGYLGQLKSLAWQRNDLHGSLPYEFWSKLTNMEELDLSQQMGKFTNDTIGTEIGRWTNLRSLVYHGLNLRGTIPSELGLLTGMEQLQIASNHLSGTIPSELGLLTACTRLSLSLNALTGTIPTQLVHLTSLERLYFQNTLLTGDVSFMCDAMDNGTLPHIDPFRVDMGEVSGCRCCTCCLY